MGKYIASVVLLVVSASVFAAEESNPQFKGAGTIVSQVLVALAVVTASVFILAWIVKRLNVGVMTPGRGLHIVSSTSLGTREKLVVVEVEGQRVLLGVTAHNISNLLTMDRVPEDEIIEPDKDKGWDFSHYIKGLSKVGQQK